MPPEWKNRIRILLSIASLVSVILVFIFTMSVNYMSWEYEIRLDNNWRTPYSIYRNHDFAWYNAMFIFLGSLAATVCLGVHLRRGSKEWIAAYVTIMFGVAILLHIHSYAAISQYQEADVMDRMSGSYYCGNEGTMTGYFYIYSDKLLIPVIVITTLISYLVTMATVAYNYLYVNTLEGPTLQDYVSRWFEKLIGTSRHSYNLVRSTIIRPTSVPVRRVGDQLYREVTLEQATLKCLKQTIADEFEVSEDDISTVIRDGNVAIIKDSDVSRLTKENRIEFALEGESITAATTTTTTTHSQQLNELAISNNTSGTMNRLAVEDDEDEYPIIVN